MKIFSGTTWNSLTKETKDTGWRNITDELNLSSITGSTILCHIRRVDDRAQLILDIKTPSTSMHKSVLLIAGSSTNVLRKIGLPKGTALSKPIPILENGTSDFIIQEPWLSLHGSGPGVPTAREAELVYQMTTRASVGPIGQDVYNIEWYTFDPWPTSLPGTAL